MTTYESRHQPDTHAEDLHDEGGSDTKWSGYVAQPEDDQLHTMDELVWG